MKRDDILVLAAMASIVVAAASVVALLVENHELRTQLQAEYDLEAPEDPEHGRHEY